IAGAPPRLLTFPQAPRGKETNRMRNLRNRNRLACAVAGALLGMSCCGIGTKASAAEPSDSGLSLTPAAVRAIYAADVPSQGPGSPATGPSGTAEAPGSPAPAPPP